MKRAFPANCPAGEGRFSSLAEGVAFYVSKGFEPFDSDAEWQTLRKDADIFEAYIRRQKSEWFGSVVQLRCERT